MKVYNRGKKLYIRDGDDRKSTGLEDTPANRKFLENQIKHSKFFKNFKINMNRTKLVDLCEKALDKKRETLKPTSIKSYESVFNTWILPYFDIYTVEVKPIFLKNWYEKFTDKSTLLTARCLLKEAIEIALLTEEISHSPIEGIKLPKMKSDYEINPFMMDEMAMILKHSSEVRNILGVAFMTGMRMGEIISLKWSDIDFKKMKIDINKTRTKGFEHTPKTKSSKAVIDLPVEALPFFENARLRTGLKEYCFYGPDGNVWRDASNVAYYYKKILTQLGLKKRGIHQTRHTFASLKLMMGERLEWVSFMLRHESPNITQEVYYKYIPRVNEKRVIFDMDFAQNRHSS